MGKYKNKLLFAIFKVMFFLFILAGCSLDSLSVKPMILFFITGFWITLFVSVNWRRFFKEEERGI